MTRPRVLFISGREPEYMRNRVLINALRRHSEVVVFTPRARSTIGRTLVGLLRLVSQKPRYDVCFVGFYGQPIAIALQRLRNEPILFDAYVSTFETLCKDRRWVAPRSPIGRLAWWLDRESCRVAAHILVDTQANAEYFENVFGASSEETSTVYVGCDESLFSPRTTVSESETRFEVFYYGAFLPLHGTDTIVKAAALLSTRQDIHFTIGGDGPGRGAIRRMMAELSLSNIDLVGWIPVQELPNYIARASVCLGGHFSTVPKAARVISTKTFQFVAMGKPTIVGDNPATRELFTHGENVYAVRMGDASALAEAVTTLAEKNVLRQRIALGGRQVFQERLTTDAIARQLSEILDRLMVPSGHAH